MHNNPVIPPIFNTERWLLSYDVTQEKKLIQLNELSRSYFELQCEYDHAPAHLKRTIYPRLKRLETLIEAMDESYTQGRAHTGSVVTSLYIEYEQMRHANALDFSIMQESLLATNSVATTLCERQISLINKINNK